jgi:hypothetical protein
MQSGEITTGLFICAGSVGDLSQCKPLEEFTRKPDANGMYAVESNLIDDSGLVGRTGLFIPEQWSMKPYIDEYGNSLVEEAVKGILRIRQEWKRDLSPELYQLRISQHPMNIKEAFAFRDESIFPLLLVGSQKKRVEDKEYPYEFIELERDLGNRIEAKTSRRQPIMEFPVDKKREDKRGVLIVYERPVPESRWGTYYASVDPVGEGKTTTSESLCSIFVYKNPVEVTKITDKGVENHAEGDMVVAAWCGRYDDITKTHEQLELIIEWYNAWTVVENNVSLFIQYMIEKRKQKYLVPKNQIVFLKEAGSNKSVYSDYGWKNTGTIFKSHLLSYLIKWLTEETVQETDTDGTILKISYGIERLPDYMALVEMEQYRPGVNVDRLVSLAALIAFAKVQQSNRGYSKRVDDTRTKNLHMSDNLYKLNSSPFRHMGGKKGSSNSQRLPRIPYRRLK